MDEIVVRGARTHNLKNLTLRIPRNKLVVVTGLSGSGKSSLAFDTLYAEGQRRYVESLSAYARQFLEMMDKPDVDVIEGLSPAIAIEQRAPSHNPRSTVGTVTEIYDYLRLLYARVGTPHCPNCGKVIRPQSAQQIIQDVAALPKGTQVTILAPLVRGRKGTYVELFQRYAQSGFVRVRVNGKIYRLEEKISLDRFKKHDIELVVDRIEINPENRERLGDSIETALKEGRGLVMVEMPKEGIRLFSEHHSCPDCGISLPEIEPRLFSFNSPYGACPDCDGLGSQVKVTENLIVPDPTRSIEEGAIQAWSDPVTTRTNRWKQSWASYYDDIIAGVARRHRIPINVPWKDLSKNDRKLLLSGDGEFEGVLNNLERRYRETESEFVKEEIQNRFMSKRECPGCHGARLKKEALSVKLGGLSIAELCAKDVKDADRFFQQLPLGERDTKIARQILQEITSRLGFLVKVGLDYVTLDRESGTLAGGEAQRIHLATQIGAGLVGVLYVLDEPTIGLHPRDNTRLLATLAKLRDAGNTLVVVEHDEETIRMADWLVDLGPGAGVHGGEIVAEGPPAKVLKDPKSLTAQYLDGTKRIPVPQNRRKPGDNWLTITGAAQFNLKDIDVKVPLGIFVAITGVSGSGKSTLVHEILYKGLARSLHQAKDEPGKFRSLQGVENLDKVIVVDQDPIGRTPRSNPATYTGAYGPIRELFAQVPEAKRRGYGPGRFSFNVKGGRCENCEGDGTLKISMQFLPDVYVVCDVCKGARFNEDTLNVHFKGKSIAQVLDMTIEEATEFFSAQPYIVRVLKTLDDVGLGYMKLGQSATTLSGGEAQRVKLATELSRRATGRTLYILDEPTTGLHFADVDKLLQVLHRLVDAGNTVVVIEHNLDVIKTADWLVDLGPEGGDRGGRLVASGPPETVARTRGSHTGTYLVPLLNSNGNFDILSTTSRPSAKSIS
ncbi:MAG: excinuclease ABC subunit UvrA [Elusimicrobia bacterium]|nr:excinuclease ABC subunit UvrA [Elusimicrobiota bacterium]